MSIRKMRLSISCIAVVILSTSCLSLQADIKAPTPGAFEHPQMFLNRTVNVCGFLGGVSNIHRDPPGSDTYSTFGLSLRGMRRPTGEHEHVCLSGRIFYLGCRSRKDITCLESSYDYAIRIRPQSIRSLPVDQ
jgi:hypothetical protein